MQVLLLTNKLYSCKNERNTNDIRTMHNMEIYHSVWEHQSTLCESRCFYKYCRHNVTPYGTKTALPKIQGS